MRRAEQVRQPTRLPQRGPLAQLGVVVRPGAPPRRPAPDQLVAGEAVARRRRRNTAAEVVARRCPSPAWLVAVAGEQLLAEVKERRLGQRSRPPARSPPRPARTPSRARTPSARRNPRFSSENVGLHLAVPVDACRSPLARRRTRPRRPDISGRGPSANTSSRWGRTARTASSTRAVVSGRAEDRHRDRRAQRMPRLACARTGAPASRAGADPTARCSGLLPAKWRQKHLGEGAPHRGRRASGWPGWLSRNG